MNKLYKIIYSKSSEKFIKSHKKEGLLFLKAFSEISYDINNIKKYDIKRLVNNKVLYRLRINKYRAIFKINENEIYIFVFDIDSRGSIYKKTF